MIFHYTHTSDDPLSEAELRGAEELLRAAERGHHVLVGELRCLERLVAALDGRVSPRLLEFLKRTCSQYSTRIGPLLGDPWVICVQSHADDDKCDDIALEALANSRLTREGALVCEDLRDTEYLILATQACRDSIIRVEPINGGGSNTPKCFEAKAKEGRVVLAVVDSDRSFPNEQLKGEVVKALQVESKFSCVWVRAFVLRCREIENIIPTQVLVTALPERASDVARVVELRGSHPAAASYADLKLGVKAESIVCDEQKAVWDGWLAEDDEWLLKPLGRRVLKQVLSKVREKEVDLKSVDVEEVDGTGELFDMIEGIFRGGEDRPIGP